MSLGTMLAMNSLASSLFEPLSALVSSALELQLVRGHMERIDDVLQTPLEQARDEVVAPPALRGNLRVRGVSFRYGEQAPLVVDGVDLDIPAGAAVALVGRRARARPRCCRSWPGCTRRPPARSSTTTSRWRRSTCARCASRSASCRSTRSSSAPASARTSR
jgi:ATP-binding cassette subfamily B protein